MSNIIH